MLLTELLTDKRGPLAKIWMSAHQEKKLSKRDAMGIDIEESVEAILTHDEGPVTLRLSGQLMLGVTRIYSRKAQSLFEDCRYTRENITKAFRPGVVDLPEDQQRTSNNAITLADTRNDFDFFDWSWSNAMPPPPTARETAGPSRQHLKTPTREYGAYNFGRIAPGSIYGGSTPSRQSQDRDDVSSKLDSNDLSGIDLNLDIDIPAPPQDDIEMARRNTTPRSVDGFSGFGGRGSKSLEPDHQDNDILPLDIDLGLDSDIPDLLQRDRRETSALSTPPPVSPPPNADNEIINNEITPRTAAKISDLPAPRDRSSPAAPKAKKTRLVQADSELELDESEFAMNRDNSDILTAERYIPANAEIVRLREIMDDPASHFLPTLKMNGDVMFYAGPQDLAPELASLFTFPANILRKRQEEGAEDDRIAKRQRVEAVEDPVEEERRVSVVPSAHEFLGGEDSGFFARDQTIEPDMPLPDFEDVPMVTPTRTQRVRSPSLAPSRAESIAREIQNQRSTGDHMLAMFEKDATAESQSQIQSTPTKSLISEPVSKSSAGYSKNTGMAMGLLRRELEAIEEEDKVIGLAQIADKASKRAASAFFFELLVLGTRDAIKLDQKTAFGDIDIRAKDKLFAEIAA